MALSLFCVIFGQSSLSSRATDPIQNATGDPTAGLSWFLAAFILLIMVGWRTNIVPHSALKLPTIRTIPKQRWGYLIALLFSFVAYRITNSPDAGHPTIAILLWLVAIGIGYFSLSSTASDTTTAAEGSFYISKVTVGVGMGLLVLSLVVRMISLSSLPTMLNGIEASIGLEAVKINEGITRNPFGTGWLTNPNLLLYVMAIPIKILGRNITAVRILSPLVGSVTVLTLFVLGKRIWGQAIAILAAILLAGSYLHIHFSRMGMTNIWDPLFVLLVLGLMAIAWQRPSTAKHQRTIWLWAGVALGFSMYAFTSSRMLPIMLAVILLLWLIFERDVLWTQFGHLVTAVAIAFIIALPILLFYQNQPNLLWERYNVLGIFDGQTGWLTQEAQRFGVSQQEIFRQQFWASLLAFNGILDNSPAFRPLTGLLSFATAVLTIIGFFITLLRIRHFKYNLLLVWTLVALIFGGAILVESPQSHRIVIAAPAVAILAGIGLVAIGQFALLALQSNRDEDEMVQLDDPSYEIVVGKRPFTPALKLFSVLLLLTILLSTSEIIYYYAIFPQNNNFADRNTEVADKISRYVNTVDEPTTVYLYGPPNLYVDFPTFTYLLAHYQVGTNLIDVEEDGIIPSASTPQLLFFYLPERFAEIDNTRAQYPNGRIVSVDGQYGEPLFQLYEVTQ